MILRQKGIVSGQELMEVSLREQSYYMHNVNYF